MAYFIELTSIHDYPTLINIENISHIEPTEEGTRIYFINASSASRCEMVNVKESYHYVKQMLNNL